jgi:hypothetical protein
MRNFFLFKKLRENSILFEKVNYLKLNSGLYEYKKVKLPKAIITFSKFYFKYSIKKVFSSPSIKHQLPDCKTGFVFLLGTTNHHTVFNELKKSLTFEYDLWDLKANTPEIKFLHQYKKDNDLEISYLLPLFIKDLKSLFTPKRNVYYGLRKEFYKSLISFRNYKLLFNTITPKTIVFFNDHQFVYTSLLYAAKDKNINTVYIPHASISQYFPPLDFDIAFLEGKEMLDTYNKISPSYTKKIVAGNIKLDSFRRREIQKETKNSKIIGFALNTLDNIEVVKDWIIQIKRELSKYSFEFVFRQHPRMKKVQIEGLNFSDSTTEDSLTFLSNIDILITGSSNIILEARLLNKKVYNCIWFSNMPNAEDNYGFIKNGLLSKSYYHCESLLTDLKGFIDDGAIEVISEEYKQLLNNYDYSYLNSTVDSVAFNINKKLNEIYILQ